MRELNDFMNEMDLTYVYRIFSPNTKECTFFSEAHRTFYKTDYIFGHKVRLTDTITVEKHSAYYLTTID